MISDDTPRGATVWLTGLPSSGKTTIAAAVATRLRERGQRAEILDGDDLRRTVSAGLGFSRADRDENVRRIGALAASLARDGAIVLVAVIAPYAAARAKVRDLHAASGIAYLEVYVATPLDVCARRDAKGLYQRHAGGEFVGLTGVDDPYEAPTTPDLRLDTHDDPVEISAKAVDQLLGAVSESRQF
ncbi:adenylylsulfate kinase [Catenulispora acidiphila DSM 44928]|uniref:Adenylyl-sulfate kinase n=1 Tax=Catenulispora acidiphila (strain DSM 44928 / JCM 14897 / NBRC 102108 / NRRL B-24433 / ID139908) TaxID=479433 RepID=C7PW65_CATAD|nr:adenylyl-sulfate kinase [Catenulispora acidiphila]ACU73313.1 adenylylsulfate kinase [Catenulispora acidiphila DSM 44928]